MRDPKQLGTFHRHLTNEVGDGNYRLFINDQRASTPDQSLRRHCGVASFFSKSTPGFEHLVHMRHLDIPNRYLVVKTAWANLPVYFHNVYAPVQSEGRAQFFQQLPRDFEADCIHIVGGDFNIPMDQTLDTVSPHCRHSSGRIECAEWLAALGVVDAWRSIHPASKVFSGPGRINRLDYIFLADILTQRLHLHTSYDPNVYGGDHLSHTARISTIQLPSSKPTWRLPRELLDDPNIVKAIQSEAQELLDSMRDSQEPNHGAMWYGWLKRLKRQLIKCHRQLLDEKRATLRYLQLSLQAAKRRLELTCSGADAVERAQLALDAAQAEHAQYSRDSQFDFHANVNERGTSHFFRKPLGTKIPLTKVTINNTTVSDQATVQAAFTAHWKDIMTTPSDAQPVDAGQLQAVLSTISKRLSSEDREELDLPITVEDLTGAIKSMNPAKSPGPDGWSAGFYQVAPTIFAEILLLVFTYQLRHHHLLLPHQRRSAVTLLHKSGDRGDPSNYRPISLMAVEVKVLSRALAFRLARHAPKLIHPTQAGFIPGRKLHDHVVLIQAIQQHCTAEDHDYFATFLDFSKAYDMVDRSFMFDVLSEMNLGPTFINWVELLYRSPTTHILFDGSLGPVIRPSRGVKQGCPLSCLLFVLYIEPLGAMLRQRPDLGIPIPQGDNLTSIFFADDSTLLSSTLRAAAEQLEIVETFCGVSGARLNPAKCKTLVLNDHFDPDEAEGDGILNILPTGQPIKYLGILLGHQLPPDLQITSLNEQFLARFQ